MIANPNDGNSPQVEVATPTISVSAGGLITASTQQGKGYVPGGSKSATQQLPTQGAKTVTPTTTEQIAVASGTYTTGDIKVAGDANLVAENIAEGVSIFGVTGTHSGGGGGTKQISVTIKSNAFQRKAYWATLNGQMISETAITSTKTIKVDANCMMILASSASTPSISPVTTGNVTTVTNVGLSGTATNGIAVIVDCDIEVN